MTTIRALDCDAVGRKLEQASGNWFPDLADKPVTARCNRGIRNRFSIGYQFELRGGDARHEVFVKAPVESSAQQALEAGEEATTHGDRPRLVPLLPVDVEARLEANAMRVMRAHFDAHGPLCTGTMEVLDLVDEGLIVTKVIRQPTLAEQLRRAHWRRSRPKGDQLLLSFQRAGEWLRCFHDMPPPERHQNRLTSRDELIQVHLRFTEYLRSTRIDATPLDDLHANFVRHVQRVLPDSFSTVTGHADFGTHNIFAGDMSAGDQIVGFDTLAYWRTSPLEDIAYFLLLVETIPPMFIDRQLAVGRALLAEVRSAFLAGYFQGRDIPTEALQVYEMLVATEKWVSVAHSCTRATGVRRTAKSLRLRIQQRALRRRIVRISNELKCAAAATESRREALSKATMWRPVT